MVLPFVVPVVLAWPHAVGLVLMVGPLSPGDLASGGPVAPGLVSLRSKYAVLAAHGSLLVAQCGKNWCAENWCRGQPSMVPGSVMDSGRRLPHVHGPGAMTVFGTRKVGIGVRVGDTPRRGKFRRH